MNAKLFEKPIDVPKLKKIMNVKNIFLYRNSQEGIDNCSFGGRESKEKEK